MFLGHALQCRGRAGDVTAIVDCALEVDFGHGGSSHHTRDHVLVIVLASLHRMQERPQTHAHIRPLGTEPWCCTLTEQGSSVPPQTIHTNVTPPRLHSISSASLHVDVSECQRMACDIQRCKKHVRQTRKETSYSFRFSVLPVGGTPAALLRALSRRRAPSSLHHHDCNQHSKIIIFSRWKHSKCKGIVKRVSITPQEAASRLQGSL